MLPTEGQSLKGDEVAKIVNFKNALGIDDPDAAAMHMEVFSRLFLSSFVLVLSFFQLIQKDLDCRITNSLVFL